MLRSRSSVSGIYVWENLVTGKLYVGLSSNIYLRFNVHISRLRRGIHWNKHLQASWNKYGEKYFIFRILEVVEQNILVEREQYWIDFYKSYDKKYGYNLNPIANRTTGYHHTPEARRKISEANLKKDYSWVTKEQKERLGNLRKGTKLTEEHKKKISDANKGNRVPREIRICACGCENTFEVKV